MNKTAIITPKTKKITIDFAESHFINDRYQLPVRGLLQEKKVEHLTLTIKKEDDIYFE